MSLLIGPLIAALVLPCAAQTYRVAGTVVDSESRKPLNRTRVTLTDGPIAELSAITVADGKFSFDVPQGKYTLLAAHRDWGDTYGKILPSSDSGAAIITGPERDTGHLEFRFRAPVAIHGKVVDQDGEPIPSATLELFLQSVVAGRKRLRSLGKAESDDFGEYYWSSLNAGTYYLAAVGEPWYYATPLADEAVTTASGTPPTPYGLSYFPGATDASAAFPLVLRPGADAQADFTLRPALGATLRFVCPDGWCGGSLNLYAMGPGNMQALIRAERTLGTEIQSVPPGATPSSTLARRRRRGG